MSEKEKDNALSQDEVDSLLSNLINEEEGGTHKGLIDEIHQAILDSGSLKLEQWISLRNKLTDIELLIPHIDLIIRLKSKADMY